MKAFAELYTRLDRTTRTSEKVAALESYFRATAPRDAAHALGFLTGRRPRRAVSHTVLRVAASEATGVPAWLIDECHQAVGDLSETIALLLPPPAGRAEMSLADVVETLLAPLAAAADAEKPALLRAAWARFDERETFLFHKLISGTFRVGVARTLVVRALANVASVEATVMAHRLSGDWRPSEAAYLALLSPDGDEDLGARPYPFCLAYPLGEDSAALGAVGEWLIEWKWDGLRAQAVRRGRAAAVWSRGEELITEQFPEIARLARCLPDGTALDGEVLAWPGAADAPGPLPFGELQKRIGRKASRDERAGQLGLFGASPDAPSERAGVRVSFTAYDLLEAGGRDLRAEPLSVRRAALEGLVRSLSPTLTEGLLRVSPALAPATWEDAADLRAAARERGAEGLMLKRLDAPYAAGRVKGAWFKWKADPFTVDAVLVYAQPGSGRRASLFTDYTFAVWDDAQSPPALVPFAKAYSGLTDEEIAQVDGFVRRSTTGRKGPVREVRPELVFELAFESVRESTRHRSGVAVRFPRIARWRTDKKPGDADTLSTVRALLRTHRA